MTSMIGSQGMMGGAPFKEKIPHGYKTAALQQFTPEQMQLFQSLFSNVAPGSFLSRLAGGEPGMFEQIEAPALKQFGALQGNLASRFSGMGLGGRRSSGFQNTLTSAASDLAQQLQSQRQGLQRQAIFDLMGLSESLLGQRPYLRNLVEKQQSGSSGWGGAIGAGLGGLAGFLSPIPGGAMAGAQLGYGIGSAF